MSTRLHNAPSNFFLITRTKIFQTIAWRRQTGRHKFAYLISKNKIFARASRPARAYLIFASRLPWNKRELKQPRRRRQQKPDKFAYLTMENSIFARFARAFFIFWHIEDVLVFSTTWNDLFCSCVDDVTIWWQMFNFVFLCPKRWFQFNSRTVRTHFSSLMTLHNWKMIAETRSYIFRWRSRFRRRRVCLSSLKTWNAQIRLILQENRCVTWRRLSPYKYPNMVKLEQNPDYSGRPPVVIWRSRPVSESAHLKSRRGRQNKRRKGYFFSLDFWLAHASLVHKQFLLYIFRTTWNNSLCLNEYR